MAAPPPALGQYREKLHQDVAQKEALDQTSTANATTEKNEPGPTLDPALLDPAEPGPTLDSNQLEAGILEPSGIADPVGVWPRALRNRLP